MELAHIEQTLQRDAKLCLIVFGMDNMHKIEKSHWYIKTINVRNNTGDPLLQRSVALISRVKYSYTQFGFSNKTFFLLLIELSRTTTTVAGVRRTTVTTRRRNCNLETWPT